MSRTGRDGSGESCGNGGSGESCGSGGSGENSLRLTYSAIADNPEGGLSAKGVLIVATLC